MKHDPPDIQIAVIPSGIGWLAYIYVRGTLQKIMPLADLMRG
jgi:hypothetical protein